MTVLQKQEPKRKKTVWAGTKLEALFGEAGIGEAVLFSSGKKDPSLPLIKYIDAGSPLSVQVHPEGKNEMWIVDEVYDHAAVWIGFDGEIGTDEVARRCADGTILSLLRRYPVKKGDVFRIAGGTVHCAAGLSFFEVQNDLDVTYRLYDHGRGRKLQWREGFAALNLHGEAKKENFFPFCVSIFHGNHGFREKTECPSVFVPISEKATLNGASARKTDCFLAETGTLLEGEGSFLRVGITHDPIGS